MKSLQITFFVLFSFLISGCVDKTPLPTKNDPNKYLHVKSSDVEFIDKSVQHRNVIGAFTTQEVRIDRLNTELKEAIQKAVVSTLRRGDENLRTIVTLRDSDLYQTIQAAKSLPVFGLLALGNKEEITCTISLLIEVEDREGKVIGSTPVTVSKVMHSALLTEVELRTIYTALIDESISMLQDEIIRQYRRVLWSYI